MGEVEAGAWNPEAEREPRLCVCYPSHHQPCDLEPVFTLLASHLLTCKTELTTIIKHPLHVRGLTAWNIKQ